MSVRFALLSAIVFAASACRAIPLADDPTMPSRGRAQQAQSLWAVDWWVRLVKTGLLEFQPMETARPAVDPDTERVYVTTRDGLVHALSPVDGSPEWTHKSGNRSFSGVAVEAGVVYVAGGDGVLTALRALSGKLVWSYSAGEELVTVPTLTEDLVIVASQSEGVFAVDRATGQWKWQYRRDAPPGFTVRGVAQPVVHEGRVLAAFSDGTLVSLGLTDGVARWERKLSVSGGKQFIDVDTTPVIDEQGRLYAASYQDGVFAIDAATGDIVWNSQRPGITSLLLRGNTVFASGDGSVTALDVAQGRVMWSLDLSDKTSAGKGTNAGRPPTFAKGYLVVPTATALAFVDPAVGRVRAAWNPGRGVTATPLGFASTRTGNRLYVLSNLGTLYALQLVGGGG